MHMCISGELFMPCFLFNTSSGNKQSCQAHIVKTSPPSNLSHLGSQEFMAKSSPPIESWEEPAETRHPPHLTCHLILSPFWTCLAPRGDATDSACLTPIPQHLRSHLKLQLIFPHSQRLLGQPGLRNVPSKSNAVRALWRFEHYTSVM